MIKVNDSGLQVLSRFTKKHPVGVLFLVGGRGLEPPLLAEPAPKAGASANFATRPVSVYSSIYVYGA